MGHIPFLETQLALSAKQQHELHLESDDRFLRNETEQLNSKYNTHEPTHFIWAGMFTSENHYRGQVHNNKSRTHRVQRLCLYEEKQILHMEQYITIWAKILLIGQSIEDNDQESSQSIMKIFILPCMWWWCTWRYTPYKNFKSHFKH